VISMSMDPRAVWRMVDQLRHATRWKLLGTIVRHVQELRQFAEATIPLANRPVRVRPDVSSGRARGQRQAHHGEEVRLNRIFLPAVTLLDARANVDRLHRL
jgi:hypothetical protein